VNPGFGLMALKYVNILAYNYCRVPGDDLSTGRRSEVRIKLFADFLTAAVPGLSSGVCGSRGVFNQTSWIFLLMA
jgi:hypothetical protein